MASYRAHASLECVYKGAARSWPADRGAVPARRPLARRSPGVVALPATTELPAASRYCCGVSLQHRSVLAQERRLGAVPGIGKEARRGRRQKRVEGERVWFMSETLGYRSCSKIPSTLYEFVAKFFLLQKSCFQKLCGIRLSACPTLTHGRSEVLRAAESDVRSALGGAHPTAIGAGQVPLDIRPRAAAH